MIVRSEQLRWTAERGWGSSGSLPPIRASLILVFGSRAQMEKPGWHGGIRARYPEGHVLGCSTAGEIFGDAVLDDSLNATAIEFADTRCEVRSIRVGSAEQSEAAGAALVRSLPAGPLAHVFVLSNGSRVNGSALVRGMVGALPAGVAVTGGLAGDGALFERTLVTTNEATGDDAVAAVGLYGSSIRVGYGSMGGWDPFGPEREVTAVQGNVLHELDGQPALELYKKYLGEHSAGLPGTGLLFPLSVRTRDGHTFVRTLLGVDNDANTLRFAGDIPQGSYARLMKANFDRLVDGAYGAASNRHQPLDGGDAELAILISCVGRKLVLQQRTEEEVDAVRSVLGPGATFTGFYSYGEICPSAPSAGCELHNQTMTITTLSER